MWQIMWLLSLVPDYVYHVLLILSVLAFGASYILKMVPFVSGNAFIIRVISAVLIVFFMWMEGGFANEAKWKARVAELEAKVAVAEKKAAETNTQIETVYVDRVQVVHDVQIKTISVIRKNASKIDATCKVTPEVISILNASAKSIDYKGNKK